MRNEQRQKLLVLDEEFPFPTNNGKRTRSFNLYARLAKRFDVRYVGYGEPASAAAIALRSHGITPIAVERRLPSKQGISFYLRLLANLTSPLPYIVTSHRSNAFHEAVRVEADRFRPDLVIAEWTPYAIYARTVNAPRLLSTHNIEADIWRRYFETESNLFRRAYIAEQWRKVRRFERDALGWVDGTTAVSDPDRAGLLQQRSDLVVEVIPNGVDLDYFATLPGSSARRNLVFTGSMDWRPNQDAARYFVREILPLLQREVPDVECTFVGRSPPPDIARLADVPGIHITGTVDDVRPFVSRAAVYVVPLRIGGGSRLKILEAMAMGRAVVSTTVGAEGLDVTHGRNVLLADDPTSFAASVVQLLHDPIQCADLAAEGRLLVESTYGWDRLALRFGDFIEKVASVSAPKRSS
jgi:glycosyltransferase involved in cell wall biosynthesis